MATAKAKTEPDTKQLNIRITTKHHRTLKTLCAQNGTNLRDEIEQMIVREATRKKVTVK